jgi:hypothetical protein
MTVHTEAFARRYNVIVDDTQRMEAHVAGIVVVTE